MFFSISIVKNSLVNKFHVLYITALISVRICAGLSDQFGKFLVLVIKFGKKSIIFWKNSIILGKK